MKKGERKMRELKTHKKGKKLDRCSLRDHPGPLELLCLKKWKGERQSGRKGGKGNPKAWKNEKRRKSRSHGGSPPSNSERAGGRSKLATANKKFT